MEEFLKPVYNTDCFCFIGRIYRYITQIGSVIFEEFVIPVYIQITSVLLEEFLLPVYTQITPVLLEEILIKVYSTDSFCFIGRISNTGI